MLLIGIADVVVQGSNRIDERIRGVLQRLHLVDAFRHTLIELNVRSVVVPAVLDGRILRAIIRCPIAVPVVAMGFDSNVLAIYQHIIGAIAIEVLSVNLLIGSNRPHAVTLAVIHRARGVDNQHNVERRGGCRGGLEVGGGGESRETHQEV
ncbi:hypothetical protein [Olsenella uli]|uniref:hypothetical protein n=1 Tax=Olsenella uli TaxID=133926 RepID=UPI003F7FA2F7